LLNDSSVKEEFPVSALRYLLLYGPLGNKPENLDRLLLTDPVGAVHGLKVDLGVPVGVEKDDNVGSLKVDAKTSSPGGKEESKLRWVEERRGMRNSASREREVERVLLFLRIVV